MIFFFYICWYQNIDNHSKYSVQIMIKCMGMRSKYDITWIWGGGLSTLLVWTRHYPFLPRYVQQRSARLCFHVPLFLLCVSCLLSNVASFLKGGDSQTKDYKYSIFYIKKAHIIIYTTKSGEGACTPPLPSVPAATGCSPLLIILSIYLSLPAILDIDHMDI